MRLIVGLSVALWGCGGVGSVSLTTWGEDFIEAELPASAFEDGFSVRFSKFVVVLHDFSLATKTGTQGPRQATPAVVDVTRSGPVELERLSEVPALKYDAVSFRVGPATAAARGVGAISADDVEAMRAAGASVWVEGSLSGATTKTFSWRFDTDTEYGACTNPDLGEGVTVQAERTETVQLTIHGDHLWYDDLQGADAKLRGQAIADADADGDGVVTQAELAAVPLTRLPLGQYGTGSAPNVKTLADFVRALTRTLAHFRGEGECVAVAR